MLTTDEKRDVWMRAPLRSAGYGGTYLKFTDSGAALFARRQVHLAARVIPRGGL